MGQEIDLLKNYPKAKRDLTKRLQEKTEEDRKIARQFGKDFFDGDRKHGYGGFLYHPRFWQPVIPDFISYYKLDDNSSILDVGCAKGFMLHDFKCALPGAELKGIDISSYAIENAKEEVKPFMSVANATNLPFEDHSFDLVISINTVHNLEGEDLEKALKEIMRVSRKHAFVVVDAYGTNEEKEKMYAWNLTAKTIKHIDEWKEYFEKVGYTGDYFWFQP